MGYTFGEFNSAEELNLSAAGLKEEGDKDSLIQLAKENGIDEYDAIDYFEGEAEALCTPLMAALGKISVEEKELKPAEIMKDWIIYIKIQCEDNPEMALAVKHKDKSINGCIAKLIKWGFEHQREIEKDILEKANCKASKVTLGIPGIGTAKKLIREYYLGD